VDLRPPSSARPRRYDQEGRADERHAGGLALERYDLIIVGGGAAGINALKAAVTMTARVALVDRGPLGGTCVNLG
jgi:Alanine dehydrogenase/PNT, C-terminal domain